MDRKSNLQDVALLRVLATFSIAVWHTYCSYTCWGVANSPANGIYSYLFSRIFLMQSNDSSFMQDQNRSLFPFIGDLIL